MAGHKYEIDEAGNLVEDGRSEDAPAEDSLPSVTPDQARRIIQGLVLSESLVILFLLGAAVYFEDTRALLLAAAVAYAVVAVFVTRYMRRTIYSRVERVPQA